MNFFPPGESRPMDSYLVDDDDDDSSECESSSEDEIDALLQGTLQQKRKLKFLQPPHAGSSRFHDQQRNSSSSEDEFEKEMNAELSQHISHLEKERVSTQDVAKIPRSSQNSKDKEKGNKQKDAFYNDVYFDSDDEDDTGNKSQHAVLSNDDLLYDPSMDDRDQTWVDRQRRKHNRSSQRSGPLGQGQRATPRPSSDALLDCPACLTTVCIDCQRHETFKNQYRAMFVMNCVVDQTEKLQCPEQPSNSRKKKKTSASSSAAPPVINSSSDLFNPVRCTECNTVVGVIDEDEVYHFFNIIASHT